MKYKGIFKKPKLIILFGIVIFITFLIFHSINNRYVFYRDSLGDLIGRSCADILADSMYNKQLSETILKEGKVEKYQALLYEERFGDICKSISEFGNMSYRKDKQSNYNNILIKICERPYGRQFAVFNESNSRVLTDDDKIFLKSKIKIYDAILIAPDPFKEEPNTYLKKDNWFKWFKQVYDNIQKLSMTELYN